MLFYKRDKDFGICGGLEPITHGCPGMAVVKEEHTQRNRVVGVLETVFWEPLKNLG